MNIEKEKDSSEKIYGDISGAHKQPHNATKFKKI